MSPTLPLATWRRGAGLAFWMQLVGTIVHNLAAFSGPILAYANVASIERIHRSYPVVALPFFAVSAWAFWQLGAGPRSGWLVRLFTAVGTAALAAHRVGRALALDTGDTPLAAVGGYFDALLPLVLAVFIPLRARAIGPSALWRVGVVIVLSMAASEGFRRMIDPERADAVAIVEMGVSTALDLVTWIAMLLLLRRFRALLPETESPPVALGPLTDRDNPYAPPGAG